MCALRCQSAGMLGMSPLNTLPMLTDIVRIRAPMTIIRALSELRRIFRVKRKSKRQDKIQ